MRTFKSIERPAQVLGIPLQDLGFVALLLIGGGMLLGVLSMFLHVSGKAYLVLLLLVLILFFGLRWLAKHKPPGYLMGWISYRIRQPRRLTLGPIHSPVTPQTHEHQSQTPARR
ncbi:hypothetical protein KLP40_14570 [Hymenobacter sp. NST-14]|uniref:hypothetical protein n=1 Tax=Hymenobacter piscis TaxID=2839984 RepID=UPI001C00F3DE|nr:hypothetical protein [Hymenobacter piscis]MBT9394392.1 hypothetical protein [Hymenobacter piscis]